ncbi:hypothetical protein P170DRAFT_478483 [Aspergillus steynii IBT 23096]|uniref:Transcription factor domain-containing protein n=1 Tax=Aspergillus steynii IBT 23096 TaxID=1392250 RepID=A0A2I2FY21_9EURO|nr:uncharacterized protein P170DRAFT_478483 [Aspergillus steynii IBT 23096]PLB45529.1 hypothetical protein P170DRAFT_478483 [Aspergillus steynii IBT 23096]
MSSSLADVFGYSEDSQSNTVALVRRVEQRDEDDPTRSRDLAFPNDLEIQQCLDKIPDGPILDFLIKYFAREVNWMDQLVHLPWILAQYQHWRTIKVPSSIFEIEFTVLTLRICSYTSEFLPSPSCTVEQIQGISLADIRPACDEAADRLAELCLRLDSKGSLLRVQHLAFAGLKAKCEGRMSDFRNALRSAIQEMGELEKETRRRVFCNLYTWDSHLSRQLDRIPILPGVLEPENMPRTHLGPDTNDSDAHGLDGFTSRMLQARLANFWKRTGPALGSTYDMPAAEERYEKLCAEFLPTLPSAFALQEPNKQWDQRLPRLPQQREMLFISIFESICYNFQPVLLLEIAQQDLPRYKQVLVSSQRKALAVSALYVLQGVSRLHSLIGSAQTRYTGIIQPTFEAAVLLVSLCIDQSFPGAEGFENQDLDPRISTRVDPLRAGIVNLRRDECIHAIRNALSRLLMLGEASMMAAVGAQTLARLLRKVATQPAAQEGKAGGGRSARIPLPGSKDSHPPVSLAAFDVDMNLSMNWDVLASDL